MPVVIITRTDGETTAHHPDGPGSLSVEHGHLQVAAVAGGPPVAVLAPGSWTHARIVDDEQSPCSRCSPACAPPAGRPRTLPAFAVGDVVQVAGGAVKARATGTHGAAEFGPDPLLAVVVSGRDEDGDVFVREIVTDRQVPRGRYVAAEHLRRTVVQ